MTDNIKWALLAGLSTVAIAIAAPATAQTATTNQGNSAAEGSTDRAASPAAETGDIIVTAQRRKERVVDVPISITVANQAQLERQQVNTFNDLNRIAPSLEIQSAPGQNTGGGGAIRGIGTQTFSAGAVASVGVVVDQVSQGNANISDLFDISRVEVLKGPQGTLFGLTTSAGVINITTNAPDPKRTMVRVRTELSSPNFAGSKFGNQIVQGVINLPVSATSALRVSGSANLRQGVNRNAFDGTWNHDDRYSVRGRYLSELGSAFTLNLNADYSHETATGEGDFFTFVKTAGPVFVPPFLPPFFNDPTGNTARLASCGVTPREGNRDYCTTQDIRSKSTNFGASGQLDYNLGPATLTSVTAYRSSKATASGSNIFRADPLLLAITGGPTDNRVKLFTQEVRLASASNRHLEYTVGAFYSHQTTRGIPAFFQVAFTPDPTLAPFPGFSVHFVDSRGASTDVRDESAALFGQATFHATDKLRLIAGARYTHSSLNLDRTNLDLPIAIASSSTSYKTEKISYRFGAQYDVAARTMAYATVSRGYKGAQIGIPSDPTKAPYIVLPEIPMSYEAGLKSTLFGGWVADLNVFYQKVSNFQAQQCLSDLVTKALSCAQPNIDGVKSRGGEISFFGKINRNLSLNTGFIYTKVTYPSGFLGSDGSNIGGTQLAYAPRYKFTLSGEYQQPLNDRVNGFLALDTVWKSRLRYEANSVRETTYHPHWMVGGRVGVRSEDDRYTAALFVRNLFNEHEPSLYQSGFPENGASNIGAIYGPQSFRQVGLSLDARF